MTPRIISIIGGAVLLLFLPMLNGGPSMFADTKAYADLGEAILSMLQRIFSERIATGTLTDLVLDPNIAHEHARASAAARSPYYALIFVTIANTGTLILVALVQALLASLTLHLALKNFSLAFVFSSIAALSFTSTLPIFVGLAMPDVFLGFGVLAILVLVLNWEGLNRLEQYLLTLTAFIAALVHATHAPVIICAAFAALLMQTPKQRAFKRSTLLSLLVGVVAALGAFAYQKAAQATLGSAIYRPPFLTARVLEDGPGQTFLKQSCEADSNAFTLCQLRHRDLSDSQAFLWERDTPKSVFSDVDTATRIGLAQDDVRFALATYRAEPIAVAMSWLTNLATLVRQARLDDIGDRSAVYRDPVFRQLVKYAPYEHACVHAPDRCAAQLPLIQLGTAFAIITLIALVAIAMAAYVAGPSPWIMGLMTAVLTNDLLRAAFSGPYPRYHTRISWLITLAGLLAMHQLITYYRRRKART